VNLEGLKNSLPGKVVAKFGEDKAINWATLIAWNGLLSMFPILLVVASVLGLVLGLAHFDSQSLDRDISSAFPDQALQNQIFDALTHFKRQSGVFAVIGFAGLLFGGSALFGSMEQGFAIIYHTRPRAFVKQKLLGFGMIIVFSVLAGIAVGTSSLLPALKSIPGVPPSLTSGPIALVLQAILGVATGFLLFAVTYFVVPNRRQEWAKVWPGALLAGVLFEAVVLLFPTYLTINKGISNYGKTFALFLMLMTFFYFLGIVVMVGVEFNSVLYPLPVEQPGNAEALAPPQSGPEGEAAVVGSPQSDYPRRAGAPGQEGGTGDEAQQGSPRRPPRARALLGVGALAGAVGVFIGQRARRG
jgi:YihY family inner membrane protein